MAREAKPVGTKGVGLKNLGAGLKVVLVNGEDQVGIRQVQLVIAAVDEDTARIKDRAHGAISEHGAAGKDICELSHPLVMLSHTFPTCTQLCGERRRVLLECANRAFSRMSGLLCYTSRVKSYAEPVQDECALTGWVCGNRHSFCLSCGNCRATFSRLVRAGV